MAKTYPVKFYANTMQGAPQVSADDAQGQLSALLKAVLVDGFGALVPDSIVWDATLGWAKATFSLGHAYHIDSIIACSGATPTDYNGEHRIMQVTTNDIWFELDATPVSDASGTLEIKIAPLGWTLDFCDVNNEIMIFSTVADHGNVSLRIDNSAWSGWNDGASYSKLCRVAMVENVIDLYSYDTILQKCWPATDYYASSGWDLVGDNRLFYYLTRYATGQEFGGFVAGYINTIRAGDRYHFIMNYLANTDSNSGFGCMWNSASSSSSYYCYTFLAANMTTTNQSMARKYHQLEGTTGWKKTGLGTYNSDVMPVPNPVDNGFYINTDQAMILESDGAYRGKLPLMVFPMANHMVYYRKNLQNLPEFPGKIFRMLQCTYDYRGDLSDVLVGFDISTVEV